MADPVSLCNRALQLVGAERITALDDDSTQARACATEYQPCVDELLQGHDWNFASRRAANLARLADGPTWGYAFAFQLPVGPLEPLPFCLFVRETSEDAPGLRGRWKHEGTVLVADSETISIRYIGRVEPGLFSPAFGTAVAFELAARLALPLSDKTSRAEALGTVAARRLAMAKALDGQEGSPRRTWTTALTEVRR